jgi:DNA polymerase-3 subunit beta
MKIKALQENLHQSLNYIQKAIPSKPPLPILSSVIFTAKDGVCSIAATDLYFGVKAGLQAEVVENGDVVIPGRQFREIIASLPPGPLELAYQDGTLTIKSENTKASLQCQNSEDFPPFPEVSGSEYSLSKEHLEKIERYISFSASADQARPVLTSVLFSFAKDGLKVVSTDGFRLALMQLPDSQVQEAEQMLVPAKALSEVYRILTQSEVADARFTVSEELKQVFFAIDGVEIYVRLIEGSFPPYEKIIPTGFVTEVIFDTEELISNIKRASIFSRDASNIVKFGFQGGKTTLTAASPSLGQFVGELSQAVVTGSDAEIAFNSKYLLDFLQSVTSPTMSFGMSDSLKPAAFKTEELENYQYIVMPFKVNR